MKKIFVLCLLLQVCLLGYADSLQGYIDQYRNVEGATYKAFNRDSHLNEVPEDSFSPFSLKLRSGTLWMMGIEEMVVLRLDSCEEHFGQNFADGVECAIPVSYTLVAENLNNKVYMSNYDEAYAYMLLVNYELPGLTLMRVTNGFLRASLNDAGNGIAPDKLEKYLEQEAEKLGESVRGAGVKLKDGWRRFQERAKEWGKAAESWDFYL